MTDKFMILILGVIALKNAETVPTKIDNKKYSG